MTYKALRNINYKTINKWNCILFLKPKIQAEPAGGFLEGLSELSWAVGLHLAPHSPWFPASRFQLKLVLVFPSPGFRETSWQSWLSMFTFHFQNEWALGKTHIESDRNPVINLVLESISIHSTHSCSLCWEYTKNKAVLPANNHGWHSLYAGHNSNCFTFILHEIPMRDLSPFYRWENRGPEK